jgi:hypothetical protein
MRMNNSSGEPSIRSACRAASKLKNQLRDHPGQSNGESPKPRLKRGLINIDDNITTSPCLIGTEMIERPEWELVDPAPAQAHKPSHALEALLGPHWRWKVAGLAVLATGLVVFFLTIVSALALIVVSGGLLSLAIGKVMYWMRDKRVSTLPRRK